MNRQKEKNYQRVIIYLIMFSEKNGEGNIFIAT